MISIGKGRKEGDQQYVMYTSEKLGAAWDEIFQGVAQMKKKIVLYIHFHIHI